MGNYLFDLSTDSTADLLPGFAAENGIWTVPLFFSIEKDGEITPYRDEFQTLQQYTDFYNELRAGGYSRTAMLNLQDHLDHFYKMAKAGVKDCVHFTISYGLSPTVDVANQAYETVKKEYPDFHLYAIESRSATVGQGLLVKLALKMRNEGKTAKETADYINEAKFRLQHLIVADDLYYLKRGGRVSGAAAVVGSMLSIKPYIQMDGDGKLNVVEKLHGMKKAIARIVDDIAKYGVEESECVVVHTDAPDKAAELAAKIEETYGLHPEVQIMGPVVGSHVGPGAVACGIMSKTRREPSGNLEIDREKSKEK